MIFCGQSLPDTVQDTGLRAIAYLSQVGSWSWIMQSRSSTIYCPAERTFCDFPRSSEKVCTILRTRPLRDIERSMAKTFPSMGPNNAVTRGWNWVGRMGTQVCVQYSIDNAYTGRVESGRFHSFEKSAKTKDLLSLATYELSYSYVLIF